MRTSLAVAAFAATLTVVQAGLGKNSSGISVYWGQNSVNNKGPTAQKRLGYYCQNDNDEVDTYMISFITKYQGQGGYPALNFANAQDNCTAINGTDLLDCPQIGEDIKTCQGLGKTILLSTGGSAYTEGGFQSEGDAVSSAKKIWQLFGPKSNDSSVPRPFGDAVIDGFDFDFENLSMNNMPAFANQLRTLFSSDTSKSYYLTAAPQCVYPDQADGPMLDGAVFFDAIWVQFYNNGCGISNYVPGATTQWNFNFDTWDNWAKKTSKNPNVKVFMGIGGNTGAANGYVNASFVGTTIDYVKNFTSFSGLMVWDASQLWSNDGYLKAISAEL